MCLKNIERPIVATRTAIFPKLFFLKGLNKHNSSKPPKIPNTMSVRTSNWKLIFNEYNNTKELYNLKQDPDEKENLIDTGLEIQEQLWDKMEEIRLKI